MFSSDRIGVRTLWRIAASGGSPQQLTGIGEGAFLPSVSRQGNRLAYVQNVFDPNIWRLNGISSDRKRGPPVKLIASTREDEGAQYSPDGKKIAFQSDRSGRYEIWVCESDGRNTVQLTFDSNMAGSPSWSHDGKWIYFGSNRTGDWQVWKMPSAGGQAVPVTRKGGAVAFESPDGKLLYYSKSLGPSEPGLWRVPVEGGEEVPVIKSLKGELAGYWAVVDQGIYFVEPNEGSRQLNSAAPAALKFMTFATGQISQITLLQNPPWDHNPGLSVSPDGRWILYTGIEPGGSDIMMMENFH